MMRRIFCLLVLSCTSFVHAASYSPPLSPVEKLPTVPVDGIHIPAGSATTHPMAEWDVVQQQAGEQTGERVLIREGADAVASAPDDASRYEASAHKYPSGAIRILKWKEGEGPVIHQITFESEIFVLEGEVEVGVGDEIVRLGAGDAAFLPSGVLRNDRPTGDTVVAQFFVGYTSDEPRASVVRGGDLDETQIVQWEEDGSYFTARTAEERRRAPDTAASYFVKRYAFDGNSIRHARLAKGGRTSPATYDVDVLIYISKGRMRRTEGDSTFEVVAGDTIREKKGATGYWELLEDSEFIATDAPVQPSRPLASP